MDTNREGFFAGKCKIFYNFSLSFEGKCFSYNLMLKSCKCDF